MRTEGMKLSLNLSLQQYTMHFVDEDGSEFMEMTEEIPLHEELHCLARGVLVKTVELAEELVIVPKELYRSIMEELKAYMN